MLEIFRRTPYSLSSTGVSLPVMVMVFTTPIFSNEWLTAGYLFVGLCIYAAGFTVFNIPYLAMPLGALLFLIHLCFFAARFVKQDFEYDSGVLSTDEEC